MSKNALKTKIFEKSKIKVSLLNSLMYESNYTLRKHCPILPTKKCILHQSPFPVHY
jgi:hypothetical protein